MVNPLFEPKPSTHIRQSHDYARDLAYLAIEKGMDSKIVYEGQYWNGPHNPEYRSADDNFNQFRKKWGKYGDPEIDVQHNLNLLVSLGYLDHNPTIFASNVVRVHTDVYVLTSKAFDLLEKPIHPPNIFISYRRVQSSAFALLIEARLRIAGAERPVIDKNIPTGDDWALWLERRVKEAEIFVCLIGPETLNAGPRWVEKEITWATEVKARIISIWHGAYQGRVFQANDVGDSCPQILREKQYIQVLSEDAKGYESAVNELLNSLGYTTY